MLSLFLKLLVLCCPLCLWELIIIMAYLDEKQDYISFCYEKMQGVLIREF